MADQGAQLSFVFRDLLRYAGPDSPVDGFELVTRAVTEGRYLVTRTLEHPERGVTLQKFVFRVTYHEQACTLLVRPGMVDDEFMAMARTAERSEEDEQRFTEMKAAHMTRLLAAQPDEVFEVVGP